MSCLFFPTEKNRPNECGCVLRAEYLQWPNMQIVDAIEIVGLTHAMDRKYEPRHDLDVKLDYDTHLKSIDREYKAKLRADKRAKEIGDLLSKSEQSLLD